MQNNSSSSPSICCPAGKNTPEQISKQKPNRKPTLKLQKYWTILSQVWLKSSILNTHRMCLPLDDLVLSATHGKAPPPSAFLQGMAFLGFQTFELSWNTSVRCCQDRTTGLTMIDISLEGIKTKKGNTHAKSDDWDKGLETASLSPEKDQGFLPQELEEGRRVCKQLHLLAQIITANPEKQRVLTGLFSKWV